jgi:hypothetical protein
MAVGIIGLPPQSLSLRVILDGVDVLRSNGELIPDESLAHVAPLGWEHIAFNDDYVWLAEPLANAFRPLRNPRTEILDRP